MKEACWVKCRLEKGMFKGEFLASLVSLVGNEEIAWFTSGRAVRPQTSQAKAWLANQENGRTTIILTDSPVVGTRRYVVVPTEDIEIFEEH